MLHQVEMAVVYHTFLVDPSKHHLGKTDTSSSKLDTMVAKVRAPAVVEWAGRHKVTLNACSMYVRGACGKGRMGNFA